jgi:hypothetical protein
MSYSEEEREQLEAQFADLDPKVIQVQILMELQQIRMALTEPQEEEETPDMYRCGACGEDVPAEKRQPHAEERHNAPKGIPPDELPMF